MTTAMSTKQEPYEDAVRRIRAKLSAGEVVVEIWELHDKRELSEMDDTRRMIADVYRVAFVHARRTDGSAGEVQERIVIRWLDVEAFTDLGASLRGPLARGARS
jgi:hypothetical protein